VTCARERSCQKKGTEREREREKEPKSFFAALLVGACLLACECSHDDDAEDRQSINARRESDPDFCIAVQYSIHHCYSNTEGKTLSSAKTNQNRAEQNNNSSPKFYFRLRRRRRRRRRHARTFATTTTSASRCRCRSRRRRRRCLAAAAAAAAATTKTKTALRSFASYRRRDLPAAVPLRTNGHNGRGGGNNAGNDEYE